MFALPTPSGVLNGFSCLLLLRSASSLGHLIDNCLTRSPGRNTSAVTACLSSSDGNIAPCPSRAGGTEDVDVSRIGLDGSLDTGDGQVCDGDAISGCAGWGTVLIILLDDDAVVGDWILVRFFLCLFLRI